MGSSRPILGVITLALAMSVLAPLPAAPSEPEVSPVSAVGLDMDEAGNLPVDAMWAQDADVRAAAAAQKAAFDAALWCPPVVSAAVDPGPLACWLALAEGQYPPELAGMNFGDLPACAAGTVADDAIDAELARYTERVEAERVEAERAAAPRRGSTRRSGNTSQGGWPGLPVGGWPSGDTDYADGGV